MGLVLLTSSAFAVTSNSIKSFTLNYGECPSIPFLGNPDSKCLTVHAVCSGQAIATLVLSNGRIS